MTTRMLKVSAHGQLVGEISFDGQTDQFQFAYDSQWLSCHDAFALSPHIPLSSESHGVGAVQRFLQNLLPEGRALDVVSINHQISKDNIFGLIALLGQEPAGALSFTLHQERNQAPDASHTDVGRSDEPMRRLISPEELSTRIRQREYLPFPVWDGKVRLSVAGYQDKLQVLVEGNQISLADGALASTHILKPEPRSSVAPGMVANEHFCMTLASAMGLPVAPVAIKRIPEPILLIERFDRQLVTQTGSAQAISVKRWHVIDGCQALDLPVSYKYERNFGHSRDVKHIRDGVSFERLFAQLLFDAQAAARMVMLQWALLQLLLGNSDAHGKNISFFMRGNLLIPAPFYDLVAVNIYGDAVEQEMAMAYGDTFVHQEVSAFDLADFAKRTGLPAIQVARELSRLSAKARALAPKLAEADVYVGEQREVVNAIAAFVTESADRLLKIAPQIPKVHASLL